MSLRDDAAALARPWLDDPLFRGQVYLFALHRVFVRVEGNNDLRKLMASGLMLVWMAVTLGIAYGMASLGVIEYGVLSAVVYTIIGIQWGFEVDTLGPLVRVHDDDE